MGPKTKPEGSAAEASAAAEPKQAATAPQKFLIRKLREKSLELFGVTTSTFDGALYGNTKEELSIEETKELINTFLYGNGGKE